MVTSLFNDILLLSPIYSPPRQFTGFWRQNYLKLADPMCTCISLVSILVEQWLPEKLGNISILFLLLLLLLILLLEPQFTFFFQGLVLGPSLMLSLLPLPIHLPIRSRFGYLGQDMGPPSLSQEALSTSSMPVLTGVHCTTLKTKNGMTNLIQKHQIQDKCCSYSCSE